MNFLSPLRRHILHLFPALLGVLLFGLSLWAISHELGKYDIRHLMQTLTTISTRDVGLAIALTAFNYVMLTGYDTLAVYAIRRPLPYRKSALVAGISYAISNTVGFALFSSSAIRYRFYSSWQFSKLEIAQIIGFCNLSFWLGLFAVGGVLFLIEPLEVPTMLHLPFNSVHPLGVLFLVVVSAYLIWSVMGNRNLRVGSISLPHLPIGLSLAQITVTSLDWALAAGVLYILLPSILPLSYSGFFGIYLLAQIAGILSHVPGGLGVFETVLLLLLSPPVDSATLLGALLAYRCIYYFLPLVIAVIVLSVYELQQHLRPKKY